MRDFENIGEIADSHMKMRFPGVEILMPFVKGQAFMNRYGVGYVSFIVKDITAIEDKDAEGMLAEYGRVIASEVNNPILKKQSLERFEHMPVRLLYSLTKSGLEVMTLPGHIGHDTTTEMPGTVITLYNSPLEGSLTLQKLHKIHKEAAGHRELVKDKRTLERNIKNLIPKANETYFNMTHDIIFYNIILF